MNVDAHLCDKEVSTDALVKTEVVKELTDTIEKTIERIKFGASKICVREHLAKEIMMFSQESGQTFVEMGNVEITESQTSMVQCPSCLHNIFKE